MTVRDLGRTGLLSRTVRRIVVVAAALALAPYLVLKVLWLAGSRVGIATGGRVAHGRRPHADRERHHRRTRGLRRRGRPRFGEPLGAAAALVDRRASRGRGDRGTRAHRAGPAAGGAPSAVIRGDVSSGGEGDLLPGVFFVVYGGFAVYGIALAILFADYVQRRWSAVLDAGPVPPRTGWGRALPAAALGLFAATTVSWAFAPPSAGLAGWESIAQRTVLVVVGLLTVVGGVALLWRGSSTPRERWAAGWIGCCTAAVQGPTLLLLANEAVIDPLLLAVTLVATPAAAWLGLSALRRSAAAA